MSVTIEQLISEAKWVYSECGVDRDTWTCDEWISDYVRAFNDDYAGEERMS